MALGVLMVDQRERLKEARDTLERIGRLAPNWDSYGGYFMTDKAVAVAGVLLDVVEACDGAAPWVVPTSAGGVQIEFAGGYEVEISPAGEFVS